LQCGVIDSFIARVPIVRGDGNILDAFVIVRVEYEQDVPSVVSVCMNEFISANKEYSDFPYFEPMHVKTRIQSQPSVAHHSTPNRSNPQPQILHESANTTVPSNQTLFTDEDFDNQKTISSSGLFEFTSNK
jgi:hypothetical protein